MDEEKRKDFDIRGKNLKYKSKHKDVHLGRCYSPLFPFDHLQDKDTKKKLPSSSIRAPWASF